MTNRLADSTSPYLLQHADNPVDWWPWGDEAFAEAARARRADPAVGRLRGLPLVSRDGARVVRGPRQSPSCMNENFVSIKVDREERPDVDAVYMEATQAMTGQGGWPMTCFLTPDGATVPLRHLLPADAAARHAVVPRSCSTAVIDAPGRTGARRSSRRAREVVRALAEQRQQPFPAGAVDAACSTGAAVSLLGDFDRRRGGFGGAPKFPPSMVLEFLLRQHERTGSADALFMVDATRGSDGPRRHLRPAGRRLRPVQRGRELGGAALREDALRQRTAAARATRTWPGATGSALAAPGGRRDRRVPADRPAHARRARSRPRSTRTPTASRA